LKQISQILKWIFIFPVKLYQIFISPFIPNSCRHIPTCSQYTVEAIQIHGVIKGILLGIIRLSKCHPWGTHGFDPVPPKKEKKSKLLK